MPCNDQVWALGIDESSISISIETDGTDCVVMLDGEEIKFNKAVIARSLFSGLYKLDVELSRVEQPAGLGFLNNLLDFDRPIRLSIAHPSINWSGYAILMSYSLTLEAGRCDYCCHLVSSPDETIGKERL